MENPSSLANIPVKWAPELEHFCPRIPIVLVCNKIDLRNDQVILQRLEKAGKLPVTSAEGKKVAKRIKAVAYHECSAKTGEGVHAVFETAVRATFRKKKTDKPCVLL